MRNIKKIYVRDLIALLKNPLALIIAGGLCVIPALYAWFNIYSNWDPYGNTSGIQIAVASEDRGYKAKDGEQVNAADSIIKTLKKNKAISWTAVKNEKAAKSGVYSGTYYAAVVFSKDFTECMYHGFLDGLKRPQVIYYENEKKNAVAAKITDTAVSNLQNSINEQYISLVVSKLFDKEERMVDKLESDEVLDELSGRIQRAKKIIDDFTITVKSLEQANAKMSATMENAESDLSEISRNVSLAKEQAGEVPDTAGLADSLNQKNSQAMDNASNAADALKEAVDTDVIEKKLENYQTVATELGYAKDSLDTLINSLQVINLNTIDSSEKITITQLENVSAMLQRMIDRVNHAMDSSDEAVFSETEDFLMQQIPELQRTMQGAVTRSLTIAGSAMQSVSDQIVKVADSINGDIDLLNLILENGVTAVDLTNQSFANMEKELYQISTKLETVSSIVEGLDETELAAGFLKFMEGNPEDYGEFFAQPVSIETEAIYPVENYGSGVTPFYTTLAIWVGGVVLVSLIKVKAHTDGLKKPKESELYLGRYLLFLTLSMIQTVIIVWGDLYLLKIQCLYPRRFLLASIVAGITFSLLIYSFTLAFGDVGKAIIVVVMVLQIAGSSGTYPIEILPEFYQKVYIFFPFPYSINAMREAICGMYENDFTLYLIRLLLFAGAALALGLIIRKPFMRINHFVEMRMEDTEMM